MSAVLREGRLQLAPAAATTASGRPLDRAAALRWEPRWLVLTRAEGRSDGVALLRAYYSEADYLASGRAALVLPLDAGCRASLGPLLPQQPATNTPRTPTTPTGQRAQRRTLTLRPAGEGRRYTFRGESRNCEGWAAAISAATAPPPEPESPAHASEEEQPAAEPATNLPAAAAPDDEEAALLRQLRAALFQRVPQELSGWLLRKPDAETSGGGGPAKAARVWAALRQTTLCLYASREAEQDGRALEWVVLSATTEVGRSAVSPAAFVLRGGGRELVLSVGAEGEPELQGWLRGLQTVVDELQIAEEMEAEILRAGREARAAAAAEAAATALSDGQWEMVSRHGIADVWVAFFSRCHTS